MANPLLDICPVAIDICVSLGNSEPFRFNLKDENGAAINIDNMTFIFTAASIEEPPDNSFELFTISGVVDDGPNGVLLFTPVGTEYDDVGEQFFDVRRTDTPSSAIRTIIKGALTEKAVITQP